jgi:ABC-type lipoprotein release transport system permease subunit
MFGKIALLNIVKHAKRSVVVFVGVALAVLVLSLVGGVIRGLTDTVLSSIIPTAGHIVITDAAAKDSANPYDLKYLIPDADNLLSKLKDDRITLAEPVLTFGALLVQPVPTDSKVEAKNLGMLGQGVKPDTRFLSNIRKGITAGAFLPDGRGIALSNRTAKLLGVAMGGSVMVLTSDRGNNPWYQELPITGLFDSGSEAVDLSTFVVSEETARTLVDAGGMTREFRFLIRDQDTAPAVAASLAGQLADLGFSKDKLRVEPWEITFSSLLTIVQFVNIITFIIRGFFVIVAGSVITNSILMTVFERTREYGTLRAIGLKKRQLQAMILTEGLLLGALGAVAGLILGIPTVLLLAQVGVDVGNATESLGFASRIYPSLAWFDVLFNFLFGTLIAVFASVYAAQVSSRLTVSESLSHT